MTQTIQRPAFLRTLLASAALAGALAAGGAAAQGYSGPSTNPATATQQQGYAGPSSIKVISVKELTATGRDDQKAILRGRIVSHDGDDHYTFDDGTGQIRVDIDDDDFPVGVKIDDKTQVELHGELGKGRRGVEFEVDEIRVIQ
ncbi:YgiW/YdeI family stress tolerance OB fold protein [Orrella dioscoreae]|uniref:Protein ygiW n=1 Tax=Orrella dioscoreae TaxID=1851544 RepID=A0A1C3JWQ2_9BURK|nr:NirD/YgiW/YdeI family stress tolerance protein [Orrella dioscoreae]SBT23558.1 Protein ygiW precursor [Orrella dioscoreae]SOE51620.1 Protein ygiW precursor [Orrella dioscoreae]